MYSANRIWKGLPQLALCVLGGLLTASFQANAATVSVNLGQTAQNLTLTGIGQNSSGLGQSFITMGACTPGGGNTTCILSGSFTGTTQGFTSGTYTLTTVYAGTGSTPLQVVQASTGSDLINFSVVPATTTITLTLVTSSGTIVVPMFAGGQFVAGTAFNFVRVAGATTCSGTPVSTCTTGQIGLVAGAVITGPVTGGASFPFGNDYYISQLAFGGQFQSTLTYINYSPQQVTCTTNFFSDTGTALSIPFAQGSVSSRTDILPPGGSIHDQTTATLGGASPTFQGWAHASCTGPVQASVLYRSYSPTAAPVAEAGVNAETAPTTVFVTFAETHTSIAYANPSTTLSALVTFIVYSSGGAQLGSKSLTLGPQAHGAALVGQLVNLPNFTGFVKIVASNPIISLSLNAEVTPLFSSLPPGDLPGSTILVP